MSSIKIFFQKLPASELNFQEKLKSINDGALAEQTAIHEIQSLKIKSVSFFHLLLNLWNNI